MMDAPAAAGAPPPSSLPAPPPPLPPPPPPLPANDVYDVINQKECGICLTLRTEQICFDMFQPRETDPQEMPYLVWKHVGLQFTQEPGKHYVCRDCGSAVFEFNRFYLMVQNVHQERQQQQAAGVLLPKQEEVELQQQHHLHHHHHHHHHEQQLDGGVANQNGHHGDLMKVEPPLAQPLELQPEYGVGPVPESNGMAPYSEPESSSRIRTASITSTPSRKRKNQEMDDEIIDFYKLVCDVCEDRIEYGTMKELNQHMKHQHGEESGRVNCPQCGKMFRTRVKLLEHKAVHMQRHQQDTGSGTATSEDDVDEKLQSEQMDKEILEFYKRISCDVCDTANGTAQMTQPVTTLYATVKELNHHMRLVHGQQAGTVKCPLCEKKIRTRPKLLEHKRLHQQPTHSSAAAAAAAAAASTAADMLLEEDSGKSGGGGNQGGEVGGGPELTEEQKQTLDREIFDFYKPIICEICESDRTSASAGVAVAAAAVVTGASELGGPAPAQPVEAADDEYRSLKQLNQHMRTVHSMESGTIKCQLCAKKFRSRVKLVEHKDMHQNPERFRCGVCQEVHQNLEEHMQNKHQEWEFACVECGKRFPFKNRLTAHMAKVHMKKDIICEECNKP